MSFLYVVASATLARTNQAALRSMIKDFHLHAQLTADTHPLVDLALSRVLLMDDARFPWLILVPRRAGMREWFDLTHDEQHELLDEIALCGRVLQRVYDCDKINIAAIGNVVAQLHMHVIARFKHDAAWPQPVWGIGERMKYSDDALASELARLRVEIHSAGIT